MTPTPDLLLPATAACSAADTAPVRRSAAAAERAAAYGATRHDLAATLLLVVVGPDAAVLAQLGVGATVVADPGERVGGYVPVGWPQRGAADGTTR